MGCLTLSLNHVPKPTATLAFAGESDYCPGEHCRFCRAVVKCRSRAEVNLWLAKHDFQSPPLPTDDEIGGILGKADALTAWVADIKAYTLEADIHKGKTWPGFKLA
jgi:hypothetical protein